MVQRVVLLFVVLATIVALAAGFVPSRTAAVGAGKQSLTMMAAGRKPLIAGNWKMNTDLQSSVALAKEVLDLTKSANPDDVEIVLIPPFTFLTEVQKAITASPQKLKLGSQNCYFEVKGAYTGAISAPMIQSIGCQYSLVGHSERRKLFREEDGDINHVVERLQEHNVTPILCIGETKEEYELGLNEEICTLQLCKDLKGLTPEKVSKLVIAYEPVWAIGTGLSATPAIAQGVHYAIRKWLRKQYGNDVAEMVRIQYGGSVTPETVDELMRCPDIDGALVGGASLVAKSFARIAMFNK